MAERQVACGGRPHGSAGPDQAPRGSSAGEGALPPDSRQFAEGSPAGSFVAPRVDLPERDESHNMVTLDDLRALATGIDQLPDERPEWLRILLRVQDNPYHRFLFEAARRLRPRLSWEIGTCEGAGAGHLA